MNIEKYTAATEAYLHHLAFGGILQNTNENKSAAGGPAYSVNVVDPREILSEQVSS